MKHNLGDWNMSITTDYEIARAVKLPHLKLEEGHQYDVLITDEMQEVPGVGKYDDNTMTVLDIVLLATGEAMQIVVAAVLKNLLNDEGDYVGRAYRIDVGEMAESGTYRFYYLYELQKKAGSANDG